LTFIVVDLKIRLRITSEFNEVSKTRAGGRFFEATHKTETELEKFSEMAKNMGEARCNRAEPLKPCSTLRALRGLDFNAMLGEAQKLKVANSRYKSERALQDGGNHQFLELGVCRRRSYGGSSAFFASFL
jgi:hypothetical protein